MEYFYCYDKSLMKFLRYDSNLNFICCGKHPTTDNMFWLFKRSEELNVYMAKFNEKR